MAEVSIPTASQKDVGSASTPAGAGSATANASTASPSNNAGAAALKDLTGAEGPATFHATQGWYIAAGITVSIMLANTKAGPFLLGILGVALLYQINLLLQHK